MLYRSHNRKEAELLRPFIGLKPMGLKSPGRLFFQALYRFNNRKEAAVPYGTRRNAVPLELFRTNRRVAALPSPTQELPERCFSNQGSCSVKESGTSHCLCLIVSLSDHQLPFSRNEFSTTPSRSLKYENFTLARGLVNMSATCSSMEMYWSFTTPF